MYNIRVNSRVFGTNARINANLLYRFLESEVASSLIARLSVVLNLRVTSCLSEIAPPLLTQHYHVA